MYYWYCKLSSISNYSSISKWGVGSRTWSVTPTVLNFYFIFMLFLFIVFDICSTYFICNMLDVNRILKLHSFYPRIKNEIKKNIYIYILTADDKYSLLNRGNWLTHFQIQLSQKPKIFLFFFFHFLNLDSILNICVKRITLIADVFLKLRTLKSVVK